MQKVLQTAQMPDTGSMRISVTSALGQIPIAGAVVSISSAGNPGETLA